jgi:hypothetical protein
MNNSSPFFRWAFQETLVMVSLAPSIRALENFPV